MRGCGSQQYRPSVAQFVDPVEAIALGEEVADDDDAHAGVAAACRHLPEPQVGLPVEARVRLVEKKELRGVHQPDRQVQLLAGAAGELLHSEVGVAGELELVHQRRRRRAPLRLVHAIRRREQVEVLRDGQLVPQQRLLRAVADARGAIDGARVASEQPDDQLHQCALSRAVLTDETDQFSLAYLQGEVLEHGDRAATPRRTATEPFGHANESEERLTRHAPSR